MKRFDWKSAVLCTALVATAAPLALRAQNATTGGDQQAQPDAQTGAQARPQPAGPRPGGGPGGRRAAGMRGTVSSVSGSNIVVKNEQGETWTIVTTDNTRIRLDGQQAGVNAIKPGDEAMAMGLPDADKHEVHALIVVDVSAAMVAKAKANMGKTYITGRILAIDADSAKLTVLRTDKVSQIITLDESTSLHKGGRMDPAALQAAGMETGMMGGMGMGGGDGAGGRRGGQGAAADGAGEAITLADVKVGDTIVGLGSVKGGSFVPTDLRVQERPMGGGPGGMGGGRRGAPGAGGDAPPQP